jgi:hypothetical protein
VSIPVLYPRKRHDGLASTALRGVKKGLFFAVHEIKITENIPASNDHYQTANPQCALRIIMPIPAQVVDLHFRIFPSQGLFLALSSRMWSCWSNFRLITFQLAYLSLKPFLDVRSHSFIPIVDVEKRLEKYPGK